jgi:hypothetical protein
VGWKTRREDKGDPRHLENDSEGAVSTLERPHAKADIVSVRSKPHE